ncbi:U7 snRNA-associated Sm-like protein LSm11 [Merluccius polli]|uniref:U7 snRNA-associated Sm-like protein LSm11 n=1 Tax=Merluccius polli TaxID=89951 RepID=A0AA47MXR5_MERPO|nr:U7 snRNA-associated Sm-like protein LSm11 [Merluccius polli]
MEERERRKLNTTEKDGDNDNDDDNDDNKLDICSDTFDPLLALYSPAVPLPFPHIKCFNNVSEYESFLRGGRGRAKPENVERRRRVAAKKEGADPARIERLRRLMVRNVPAAEGGEAGDEEAGGGGSSSSSAPQRRKQRIHKNVVVRMQLNKGSPLGELYRCVEEKIRVKVHIRTFKGLRGVCSGFVVAFDKFWNLAMVDVDETYRDPLLGDALYHEKALTVTRLFEKLKLQESSEETARTGKGKGKKAQPPQQLDPGVGPRSDPRRLSKSSVQLSEAERGAEAGGPTEAPGKSPHPYGKVHTRHLNQLFIRGENVLLINLQPLS